VLDAAGQREAGQPDGGDAQHGARQIEPVAGQILRPVGRDAEPDADAGDQGDRGVDEQQPLPPHVRQGGAAEQRAEDEAGHADDDHHGDRAHPQRLVVEQPEDERVGDRRHGRGGDAERGAQSDQLAGGGDEDDAQAQQPEHGESGEQHSPASQAVGQRSGGQQQAAERQRVRAGDPLQRGGAAAEVPADRGQRDRQQRVVDHLHEEGQAERGERDPRRAQRRVRVRRGACHGLSVGDAAHSAITRRSHPLTSPNRGCEGRVSRRSALRSP